LVLYDLKTKAVLAAPVPLLTERPLQEFGYHIARINFTDSDNPTLVALRWATAEDGLGLRSDLETQLFFRFHNEAGTLYERAQSIQHCLEAHGWEEPHAHRFAASFWYKLKDILGKSGYGTRNTI